MQKKVEKENRAEARKIEIEYIKDEKKEFKEQQHEAQMLKKKLKKKESEIKSLKKETGKLKEEYLRQLAEKENLRKRIEREKNEYYDYALSELLRELLVILDNFERALESEDQGDGSLTCFMGRIASSNRLFT